MFIRYVQELHLNQEIPGLQLGPKNRWHKKTELMTSALKKNENQECVILYSKKQSCLAYESK